MKTRQILVVEDERIVAEDIKMRLQKLGYTVPGVAFSGEEAVKKAEEILPNAKRQRCRREAKGTVPLFEMFEDRLPVPFFVCAGTHAYRSRTNVY